MILKINIVLSKVWFTLLFKVVLFIFYVCWCYAVHVVCLYEKVRFPGIWTQAFWKSSQHSQTLSHFSSPHLYKIYFIFIETKSHNVVTDILRSLCNPGCLWTQISPCYYLLSAYIKECDTMTNPQSPTLDIIPYINYFIYIRIIFMHKGYLQWHLWDVIHNWSYSLKMN